MVPVLLLLLLVAVVVGGGVGRMTVACAGTELRSSCPQINVFGVRWHATGGLDCTGGTSLVLCCGSLMVQHNIQLKNNSNSNNKQEA
jgi:hypothetical protein